MLFLALLFVELCVAALCNSTRLTPRVGRVLATQRYAVYYSSNLQNCGLFTVEYATGAQVQFSTDCLPVIQDFEEQPEYWSYLSQGRIFLVKNAESASQIEITASFANAARSAINTAMSCTKTLDVCFYRDSAPSTGGLWMVKGVLSGGSLVRERVSELASDVIYVTEDDSYAWAFDGRVRLSVIRISDGLETVIPVAASNSISFPQRADDSVFYTDVSSTVFTRAFVNGTTSNFADTQGVVTDLGVVQVWTPELVNGQIVVVTAVTIGVASPRRTTFFGVSERVIWPLVPPKYQNQTCSKQHHRLVFGYVLLICNGSMFAARLDQEATDTNVLENGDFQFDLSQSVDVRSVSGVAFVTAALIGRSGGNDVLRVSVLNGNKLSVIRLTPNPIPGLTVSTASASYDRNEIPKVKGVRFRFLLILTGRT